MRPKQKGPSAMNTWPSINTKSLGGEFDAFDYMQSWAEIQAARHVATRYCLPFPTAKLICQLSGLGGV